MLDALRKRSGGLVAKILIGILVASLAVWGVFASGSSFFGANQSTVATVGSQTVTATAFQTLYNNALTQVNQLDGYTTPQQAEERYQLSTRIVSQLVLQAIVLDQASKMRLGVSDEAMAAQIQADPNFADSTGAFSLLGYRSIISQTYGTEANYLVTRRPMELQGQIEQAVAPPALELPLAYRQALWEFDNEQRDILLAHLTAANLGELPEPTEEQIVATYTETAATTYQAPEARTAVILSVNPVTLAQPDTITEDELRAAYAARSTTFGTVETRHVLIQVLAADRAAAVQAMLDAGQTYDQLVAAAEIAPAEQGVVPLTYFSANPAVGEAAFALEPGGTTIVDGRFGRTLVHIAEVNPATIPPFEEVAAELRQDLAEERAAVTIRDLRDQIEDARAGGATLAEVAVRFNLVPETITMDALGNDAVGQPLVGLPGGTQLVNAVFQSDVGYADAPLTANGGYVWYDVVALIEPHQRPIEEVRDQVIAAWKKDDVAQRLQDLSGTVNNRLQAGESLFTIAASLDLTLETVNDVTRSSPPTNTLSDNAILSVFAGPLGYVGTATTGDGEGMVIFQVIDVTVPPFDPAVATTTAEDDAVGGLANDLMQGYVQELQAGFGDLQYNVDLVRQLAGLTN